MFLKSPCPARRPRPAFTAGLTVALLAIALAPVVAQAQSGAPSRPSLPTAGSAGAGVADAGRQTGRPADFALRDGAGNLIIVNGQLQSADAPGGMASDPLPSAGGQSATAIGNQLVVLATGSWNTIIIDSQQNNSGDVTASTSLTQARSPR